VRAGCMFLNSGCSVSGGGVMSEVWKGVCLCRADGAGEHGGQRMEQ
jgi:hypothetical protein